VLSEKASITGKPAAVFTENRDPERESLTENNLPDVPSTANTADPLPITDSEDEFALDPDINIDPLIKADPDMSKTVLAVVLFIRNDPEIWELF
jgi:hypothetical protein